MASRLSVTLALCWLSVPLLAQFQLPHKAFRVEAPRELQSTVGAFLQDWSLTSDPAKGTLLRLLLAPGLGAEGYELRVGNEITIQAGSPTGAAWALSSLGQLLSQPKLTPQSIKDKPAVAFRGVLLDVARRYHSPATLRTLIRWCNMGKVNTLILHLTDDQNWMLPSSVLPGVDANNSHRLPAFTREELIDLQTFASSRGVSIVPEVDLPGHSSLLVKSDPEFFRIHGSESDGCVNFGSPMVREKLKRLLDEVIGLFPSAPYIHLGGDEAWYPNAEKDPQMAASMAALGAGKSPGDVFVDFVGEMARHVIAKGKTPIVWEGFPSSEFAKKTIPKQTLIVAWEGTYYPAKQLIPDGFKVINSGWDPYYVVNHYPYDVDTLVPLERLLRSSYLHFGIVTSPAKPDTDFLFQDPKAVSGSLLCWWEGREWNALTTLPPRILAFGQSLWNPGRAPKYEAFWGQYVQFKQQLDHVSEPPSTRPPSKATRVESLTTGCPVTVDGDRDPQFSAQNLVDGVSDDPTGYWLAYPCPQSATVDLKSVRSIERIQIVPVWINAAPTSYRVEGSVDGKTWQVLVDRQDNKTPSSEKGYEDRIAATRVRYLRLTALGGGLYPSTMCRILEFRAFTN